jgi:tetratricopeptide (TPR) repeat protein
MLRTFFRQYRQWERTSQLALAMALGLLLLALAVAAWGPADLRPPAWFGACGLLVAAQAVVMWSNRGMVTAYTRAQRLYLAEDFAGACDVLEGLEAAGKADARSLALLGNAYRQRAMLDESERALRQALTLNEDFYFSLYGFGRTLIIQSRYAEAGAAIERALAQGGPPVIHLDAAEAYFRLGDYDSASRLIDAGLTAKAEAYRRLMGQYLRHRMGRGAAPDAELVAEGLLYWVAQAERYHMTDYGRLLANDILAMQANSEEA